MALTDTTLESWYADFRTADRNTPADADQFLQTFDDQLRMIKSAVVNGFTGNRKRSFENWALTFTTFSDRLEYTGDHTDVLLVGRRVYVTKSSGTANQGGWILTSTYDEPSNKTTATLLLDTDGATHTNTTAVLYGAIKPYPQKSPIPHYYRCGVVTVSDGNRTGTVTLSPEEWTTDYMVYFTNSADAGAGISPSARNARLVTAAVDHFEFELDAAPGSGASVTFDWVLVHAMRLNP